MPLPPVLSPDHGVLVPQRVEQHLNHLLLQVHRGNRVKEQTESGGADRVCWG